MNFLKAVLVPTMFCMILLVLPQRLVATIWEDARRGDLKAVQNYINNGDNVDVTDVARWTPIYWAAVQGHKEVVNLLLENGANIQVQDVLEKTPLWWSVYKGQVDIVKLFLEKGAKVDAKVLELLAQRPAVIKSIFGMRLQAAIGTHSVYFKKPGQLYAQNNDLTAQQAERHCSSIFVELLNRAVKKGPQNITLKEEELLFDGDLHNLCKKFIQSLVVTDSKQLELTNAEAQDCKKFFKITPLDFFNKRNLKGSAKLKGVCPFKNDLKIFFKKYESEQ